MNSLQQPKDAEKFSALTAKFRARFLPETVAESALCDQLIIANWHYRTHKAYFGHLDRQVRKLSKSEPNSLLLPQLQNELRAAEWQCRRQKNFAWRKRKEFWALRYERVPRQPSRPTGNCTN